MLALLAALTVAQTPVALVQSSNFGVPPKRAAELTHELGELLKLQGLKPVLAATPCGNHACLIASARELRAGVVISMGFAMVVKETLVDVEALQVSDEKSLTTATFKIQAGSSFPAIETTQFLVTLKGLMPAPPAATVDTPKKDAVLVPEQRTEPPPEVVEPAPSGGVPISGVAVGIGALVAGAVALALVSLGVENMNYVTGSITNGVSTLTLATAHQYDDRANLLFTVGSVCGGLAAALLTTSIVLFATSQP